MLICHCRNVTDRAIREAVREGYHGVEDVTMACGAAGGCGGCHSAVRAIVDDERGAQLVAAESLRFGASLGRAGVAR